MAKVKKPKVKAAPEPYWSDMVSIFFAFCREKFHTVPSFDNSAPRDLKAIIHILRLRAEKMQREWTYEVATTTWRHFLEYAHQDEWLRNNFILFNLNRQKDKIFFKIANENRK